MITIGLLFSPARIAMRSIVYIVDSRLPSPVKTAG
jgi:hypothetical protein